MASVVRAGVGASGCDGLWARPGQPLLATGLWAWAVLSQLSARPVFPPRLWLAVPHRSSAR